MLFEVKRGLAGLMKILCQIGVIASPQRTRIEGLQLLELDQRHLARAPYPRKLHLLDNDFFGHESWRNHIREIIDGNFRVCLSQGINVRMITTETAEALASIQ